MSQCDRLVTGPMGPRNGCKWALKWRIQPNHAPDHCGSDHAEILGLVATVDEFKGAWRALGTLVPD